MNETLIVVFLGLIAAALIVQTAFMAVTFSRLSKAAERLRQLADELERQWPPLRERIAAACDEIAALSQSARSVAQRTESVVDRVTSTAEHAGGLIRAVTGWPVTPWGRVAAVVRAIRRGIEFYRGGQARRVN
jgi:hypothetical protein